MAGPSYGRGQAPIEDRVPYDFMSTSLCDKVRFVARRRHHASRPLIASRWSVATFRVAARYSSPRTRGGDGRRADVSTHGERCAICPYLRGRWHPRGELLMGGPWRDLGIGREVGGPLD